MGVAALGYVALDVTEMSRWRELMTCVFGMQALERPDGAIDLRLDDRHHRLTLYPASANALNAVGWEMAGDAELDELVARLAARGIQVSEGSPELVADRRVRRLVRFLEPNLGLHTELFVDLERARAPLQAGACNSGYLTGALGLGHLVFSASDPAATIAFYQEVMGFEVSDHIVWDDKAATFLHCNPRHHSLAVMNEFGPLKGGDLNHIMFEVKDFDDLGRAFDLVRDRGFPLLFEMGKHTNDHMHSFYVITPSGFAIEYGFGGRLIGEGWEITTYDRPMIYGHRAVA